jgi:hypothetical protein
MEVLIENLRSNVLSPCLGRIHIRRRCILVVRALALLVVGMSLAACSQTRNENDLETVAVHSITMCRAGVPTPVGYEVVVRSLRKHGFSVVSVRDKGLCSAVDVIYVLTNIAFSGQNGNLEEHGAIVRKEGHVSCILRKRPIYADRNRLVTERFANWYELRYENVECGVTGRDGFASRSREKALRRVLQELARK